MFELILILVALVVAAICSGLFAYGNYEFSGSVSTIIFIFSIVVLLFWASLFLQYVSAKHKTEIINKEFQTDYSVKQIFWAEDVIKEVREVKRQRIELNGNLMQDSK